MMQAIINQPGGDCYVSAVFGYYRNVTATDDYQRYVERIHNPYYIVWDKDHTKLTKWLAMVPNTKYIIPQILIIDTDDSNWVTNEDGEGCINFLTKELIDIYTDSNELPDEIYQKCSAAYADFIYNETAEIKSDRDIENLMAATGYFHDARIVSEHLDDNGVLHVHFDGTWGCEVDVWFWDNLEYDTSSKNQDNCDPYWYGSSVILHDGFVYFVDEDDMQVDEIGPEYCYFKARHMKYRIVPQILK